MAQAKTETGHPRGLYVLFFTEMWERFSYYGMRAIFILFLTKALVLSEKDASNIYGSYTGLVYLTPLLGGYISDKFWGNRRSILVGGILMAIGQFLMFMSGSLIIGPAGSIPSPMSLNYMWAGLTFLIIGNGFFKPNISTMVGQLYPEGDSRIDSAFTIFYMGINLGAFFSPLICGSLGDTGNVEDFKYGFLAASIGMVISVISFEIMKNKHLRDSHGNPIGMPKQKMDLKTYAIIIGTMIAIFGLMNFKNFTGLDNDIIGYLIYASFIIMPAIILSDKKLTKIERERIIVVFILAFFVIFFWACFEQAGASLTIFADKNVDRNIVININKYLILGVSAVVTYFLSGFLAWFFNWTKTVKWIVTIVVIGLLTILTVTDQIHNLHFDEFPASWFQSVNPLAIILLAPLFTMLWGQLSKKNLEPPSPLKMVMGLALIAVGYVIIAYAVHGVNSSTKIAMFWLIALYVVHTMGELCLSPIGLSLVSKLAPLRLSSLLMGTWFLANAAANKFAGTLSALIPPDTSEVAVEAKMPSIFGIEISDLFVFFCVFIVLSGAGALVLLAIYRKLLKMMHGVR